MVQKKDWTGTERGLGAVLEVSVFPKLDQHKQEVGLPDPL